jgi:hypothetical protein
MAPRASIAVIIGGGLIVVWGAELVRNTFSFLDMSNHSLLSTGAMLQYEDYVSVWMAIRIAIAIVGLTAGVLIWQRKNLGHWLNILSAAVLLGFATDFHWYASLVPGKLMSEPLAFFFIRRPALGYGVIIFPALVTVFLIVSVVILAKQRKRGEREVIGAI